ncbi:MAG: DUF1566 domain-containing protein, partial [Flavobacteriales bacterium]|nr:DUF1566 domain-containing protein [Flavobacteriales bacterium]
MDSTALNYNSVATCDDGICILPIYGCMDSTMWNYNPLANVDDGSCEPFIYGCNDASAFNYNSSTNTNDGSCCYIGGCTDPSSIYFDSLACYDDGSCTPNGAACDDGNDCTINDVWSNGACVGGSLLICDDGDPMTMDVCDGSVGGCIFYGCTDPLAFNFNPTATSDNGSCIAAVNGCTDSTAFNYNPLANTDDGSCIAVALGCTDSTATNYNSSANTDDGSCIAVVNGCTDSTATNYDPLANTDDGSCIACINGCMNSTATNYDSTATCDDGSCVVEGCTTSWATNYNSSANVDDGSCIFPNGTPCSDGDDCTYNDTWINGACQGFAYSCDDGDPCTIDVCDGVGGCVYISTCSLQIGQTYQGGIIFYLDGNGGGLICDIQDLADAEWGCVGTDISGADGDSIGTGSQNTIDILAGCTTTGIAADICANLTLNGYSDWFLPSKDELNQMYLNIGQGNALGLGNIGGFSSNNYWSSSEYNATKSKRQDFFNGYQGDSYKSDTLHVRAVRAFGTLVSGCTDSTATNYNPLANTDDGSCITVVYGCMDSTMFNYSASANTDDGSCIAVVYGCTDST